MSQNGYGLMALVKTMPTMHVTMAKNMHNDEGLHHNDDVDDDDAVGDGGGGNGIIMWPPHC